MAKVEREFDFKGVKTVRLEAGGYTAVIAYSMGSSVLRLRNEEKKTEVFRYKDEITAEQINEARYGDCLHSICRTALTGECLRPLMRYIICR